MTTWEVFSCVILFPFSDDKLRRALWYGVQSLSYCFITLWRERFKSLHNFIPEVTNVFIDFYEAVCSLIFSLSLSELTICLTRDFWRWMVTLNVISMVQSRNAGIPFHIFTGKKEMIQIVLCSIFCWSFTEKNNKTH